MFEEAPPVSIGQAQAVVDKHFSKPDAPATIVKLTQVVQGFSYTPGMTTYLLDLAIGSNPAATQSSFLVVSSAPAPQLSEPYAPNALSMFPTIISLISSNTPMGIPQPILDTSCTVFPYPYLVTPMYPLTSARLFSLADARATNLLTPEQQAFIDLQLGQYLGALHSGAQNDWFGLPSPTTPADPSYDWQETFTALLESLLDSVSPLHPTLDLAHIIAALRLPLARAIGAFLFADADTPSLVWLTGSADDVFLAFTPAGEFSAFALLPSVAHALWGDPLLEAMFAGASDAFWEGYRATRGEQDGSLMVFPRQRTKRVWYDVFLALLVLHERRSVVDEKTRWAGESLRRSAEVLKDAPCY
ncbi:hypothetical protein C8F04DRAFT_1081935 [Mycena alexandri]|uniref:Aminoglycoside phosphotransferase domain-containing protein n=1 Tax=Mycena alexandri TaxID=1745969 RepID=A0AAD6T947_9AGAR|nr:hypothetical protein C8F04DRAFT_1081935 [Mycena alexandri]